MKHITTEYGQPCNYLELTEEEYKALDGFLRGVGVQSRRTTSYNGVVTIQAENPYKTELICYGRIHTAENILKFADEAMSEKEIMRYKW